MWFRESILTFFSIASLYNVKWSRKIQSNLKEVLPILNNPPSVQLFKIDGITIY